MSVLSCSSQKNIDKNTNGQNSQENFKTVAFERYGNDTTFQFSTEETYVLCEKQISNNNLNPNIISEFFVINLKNSKIVYDDKISGAKIKWISDKELLIIKQMGIITSLEDEGKHTYIFNVETHLKTEYHEINNKN